MRGLSLILVFIVACGPKAPPPAAPAEPAASEPAPAPTEPKAEGDCDICYMGCMEGAVMELSDEEANAECEAECGC